MYLGLSAVCLSVQNQGSLLVAVKVFDQSEVGIMSLGNQEITRSYSDMRYELNKLCTLSHDYIVRFVGVFTNPHCFVLEWAPLHSLEHQRAKQSEARVGMCYYSIMKTLYQVCVCMCVYVMFEFHTGGGGACFGIPLAGSLAK